MKETITEQFKVIEDAVKDLKEMIDTPATKESLTIDTDEKGSGMEYEHAMEMREIDNQQNYDYTRL